MRALTLCWISLTMALAGCGAHECASKSDSEGKSTATECKAGDCCATPSRAAILQGRQETTKDDNDP